MINTQNVLKFSPLNLAYLIVNGFDMHQIQGEINQVIHGKFYEKCEIVPKSTRRIFFLYNNFLGRMIIFYLLSGDKMFWIEMSHSKGGGAY